MSQVCKTFNFRVEEIAVQLWSVTFEQLESKIDSENFPFFPEKVVII